MCHALQASCQSGDLNLVRWTWSLGCDAGKVRASYCLAGACDGGHAGVVRWLHEVLTLTRADVIGSVYVEARDDADMGGVAVDVAGYPALGGYYIDAFGAACQSGSLETARLVYSFGLTLDDVRTRNATPLAVACEEGHLDVVRWLWSLGLGPEDACAGALPGSRPPAFVAACAANRVEAAAWLMAQGVTLEQARAGNCRAYVAALTRRARDVAKWLESIGAGRELTHEEWRDFARGV